MSGTMIVTGASRGIGVYRRVDMPSRTVSRSIEKQQRSDLYAIARRGVSRTVRVVEGSMGVAMRAAKVNSVKRFLIYNAVRIAGWCIYREREPEPRYVVVP